MDHKEIFKKVRSGENALSRSDCKSQCCTLFSKILDSDDGEMFGVACCLMYVVCGVQKTRTSWKNN